MTAPDSRTRRQRSGDTVIDLRQAAASRQAGVGTGAPAPADIDLAAGDLAFLDAVTGLGGQDLLPGLGELGRHAGSLAQRRLVDDCEAAPPRLETHDAAGDRVDRVVVHPSWPRLWADGEEAGLGGRPWTSGQPHAHLARAAGLLLWAQTAGSSATALSTHHAVAAAVAVTPAAGAWLPRLAPRRAGSTTRRGSTGPRTLLAGLAVTERGTSAPGSLPTTVATQELGGPVAGGPTWRIGGRKWFAGNADAAVLLVTAATEDGVGTFLVPRPTDRSVRVDRLRRGTAHRAWVVGDLSLQDAWGVRLDAPGDPGRRPAAVLDAARALDSSVLAAASLRAAVRLAGTHARHRQVPGGPLDTVPLVRTLLADLAVESEAATLLALRLAGATDRAGGSPAEAAFLRLAAPVAAAWLSRRAPLAALEARELVGSPGWDERSEAALVHAQSGAVLTGPTAHGLAAEAVRVLSEDTDAVEAYLAVCAGPAGASQRLDAAAAATADLLRAAAAEARQDPGAVHAAGRWLVERLAVTLQGALVVAGSPRPVVEAFLASRLDPSGVRGLGTLPLGSRQAALVVDRALGDA